MSISDTEERIISVICNHVLNGVKEKLTIALVSDRVGISRQAFYKNYLHLKPYVTGKRAIDDLLLRQGIDSSKVILQTQKLVRDLESELADLRSTQDARFQDFENNLLTSLMHSDILTHRTKELTAELRKKAMHVELLKRQITEMELEKVLDDKASSTTLPLVHSKGAVVQLFKPNLSDAATSFSTDHDAEAYTALKHRAIEAMQQKILKVLKHGTIRVVVFQERYLCSFEKFIKRNFSNCSSSILVINLPLYSRIKVAEFLQALKGATPLEVYVPHCDSEAVINAQRGFLFGHIPDFEFKALSKEPLPTIFDGYDKVTVFRITQGE